MQQPGLEIRDLSLRRGERRLFASLTFSLPAGAVLILGGANGAGKSSLLRALAGLVPIESGRLLWAGAAFSPGSAAHRRRLCYIGHEDAVRAALTVAETLRFWSALLDGERDARALLAAFDLAPLADWPALYLSAGQRRRLALTRLLLRPAPLWLLDEPMNALDAAGRRRLLQEIARHRGQGGITLVASHERRDDIEGASHLDLGAAAAP